MKVELSIGDLGRNILRAHRVHMRTDRMGEYCVPDCGTPTRRREGGHKNTTVPVVRAVPPVRAPAAHAMWHVWSVLPRAPACRAAQLRASRQGVACRVWRGAPAATHNRPDQTYATIVHP